ncbi:MAG: hypothetical protein M3Z24_13570, partial [Chloroflexota bacterium]|nr:hypothetical protein [Chloroflexota bacterium]
MALYQFSWTILLAPLFSFAVIIFGTRVWDLLSRPRSAVSHTDGLIHPTNAHGEIRGPDPMHPPIVEEPDGTASLRSVEAEEKHGDDFVSEHGFEDDENPKVPRLTMGAKASAYVGIVIMALAAIYSWILLLDSAGVIHLTSYTLPQQGITVLGYEWYHVGNVIYTINFHLDRLAIVMLVVVTSVSLLVQFYSQGYMEISAGYARFYSYLSLFTFSMLVIVFAENFLVMFIGWELVGLSSYLLIGFWINKKAKPAEDRLSPASAAIEAFITTRVGDVGFMIGIMILFANTHTFQFSELYT